ncbi:TPA: hypothetical protein ACFMWQ_000896 [Neisseria meningitidis]|uniref:Putative phage associated protein n=1 Tax=Neisseria meningitidis (strain alpha14) TaxID=662598 RepID=C6S6F1_NEIML|nr:hypothetical protein [Neisseria meningitidis]RQL24606.1 hypothetical protein COH33_11495 [Neisseria meningitidis]CBA05259.1 putative phage associated protein [Neisseria meningitidis alpha14]
MVDEKLAEYRKRAEAKRTTKKVSFNLETEKDILDVANNIDFSQWVKEKLREKLKKELD